jgi:hypothetical protein
MLVNPFSDHNNLEQTFETWTNTISNLYDSAAKRDFFFYLAVIFKDTNESQYHVNLLIKIQYLNRPTNKVYKFLEMKLPQQQKIQ